MDEYMNTTSEGVQGKLEFTLHELFMQSPSFLALLRGPDHIFELCNVQYMKLIGENREVLNKPVREALPEIENQGFLELLDKVYNENKPYRGKEMLVRIFRSNNENAEEVYLNFIYQPYRDEQNRVHGILVHGVDVTEQVLARKSAQESEEKYRSIFETMDQGFCIMEMIFDENDKAIDYRFLEINPVFEEQTGLRNARGKTARELVPDLEKRWFDIYGDVAKSGKSIFFTEGSAAMGRWFDVHAFRVGGENSKKIALLFSDITKRKQAEKARILAEEKLKDFVENLEKTVEKRTIQLQRSNEDLQQFAHVASHDLKEPVRKIKTFVNLLEKETAGLSEKANFYIDKIQSATDRMQVMIEGVLNYSSQNSRDQAIELVDLNKIIKNVISDLEVYIQEKKAQIDVNLSHEIEGASVLIYQLFYNLIYNAIKFSKPDVNPVILITSSSFIKDEMNFLSIVVKDNGIGFKPENADKIFNTFVRLNSKDQFEGTGLGLSLCKKIVERHGGEISSRSVFGEGSEFIVELPFVQSKKYI